MESYRVWHIVNSSDKPEYHKVGNVDEGIRMMKILINRDLEDSKIDSNSLGLEVYTDDGWRQWKNDEGFCAMDIIEGEDEG